MRCRHIIFLLAVFTGMLLQASETSEKEIPMKSRRRIVISSLGPRPLPDRPTDNQEALDIMIKHWSRELAGVLPDRPDLIVLPEACDRFPMHTMEERFSWYEFRGNKMLDFKKWMTTRSTAAPAPTGPWATPTPASRFFRLSVDLAD